MERYELGDPRAAAPPMQRRHTHFVGGGASQSLQSSPRNHREMAEVGAMHSGRVVRRELLSSGGSADGGHPPGRGAFSTGGPIQHYVDSGRHHTGERASSSSSSSGGGGHGGKAGRRRASIAVDPSAHHGGHHVPRASSQPSQFSQSSSGFPKPLSSPRGEGGPGGNLRVVVRIRPLSRDEKKRQEPLAVHPSRDPLQPVVEVVTQGPRGSVLSRRFNFHCVAGPEEDEVKLLRHMGLSPLLDSALAGYGATIMCYGQTGSGKTHTLFGKAEEAATAGGDEADGLGRLRTGLVAQSLQYIYATMQKYPGIKYTARVTCLEIHNEQIYDLLDDGVLVAIERGLRPKQHNLPVRWDANRGFHVQNLRSVECEDVSSALHVMWRALLARRVGAHELNRESSRSHCMMTLHLEAKGIVGGATSTRYGKVAFVDLAGSERLKASKSSGDTLKETTNINKSLLTLGKVVSALSETGGASSSSSGAAAASDVRLIEKHIPYRDSKLTKLLMDSLGGSCLSCIVACCSPGACAVDETLSTLNYATRAKHIVNKPIPQMDPHEGQIAALKGEIQLLRRENRLLRTHLGISEHVRILPAQSREDTGAGIEIVDDARQRGGAQRQQQQQPHADARPGSRPRDEEQPSPSGPGMRGAVYADADEGEAAAAHSSHSSPRRGSAHAPEDGLERNRSAPLPPFASPLSRDRRGSSAMDGFMPATDLQPEENFFAIPKAELVRRLKDMQNLINEFSAQNERIAHENERIRGSRQMLELDYKYLVNENEKLQAALANLEDVFIGADDGTAEAFGRMSMGNSKPSTSGSCQ